MTQDRAPNPGRSRRLLISLAKPALAALVLYAAGSRLAGDLARLRHVELEPWWLAGSAAFSVVGLVFFGAFWRLAVHRMGGEIGAGEAQRAYVISQLGKYVPGKALVIVMRCALTRRESVTTSVAVIATFYETLALMAVGAVVSLVALAAAGGVGGSLMLLAAGLSAGLLFVVLPPVFSRAVALVALPFKKRGEQLARPPDYSILPWAFALLGAGWVMLGLSVAAAGAGVGAPLTGARETLLAVGASGLSTTSGFVMVFLPAGLGAREYVLTQALSPVVGSAAAALTAVTARLAQVAVELVLGGALFLFGKRRSASASSVIVEDD